MFSFTAYFSMFISALTSATVLPGSSEAVLVALLLKGGQFPWVLVLTASVGNILGSAVNWYLGCRIEKFRDKKWFPVKPAALARAQHWYQRHGRLALLLCWMPVVGDPLTLAAGVMKERFWFFMAVVTIAKTARYIAVAVVAMELYPQF